MSVHSSSVFNNSCLTQPRNPRSQQPSPVYEQKHLNQLRNEAKKLITNEPNMKARISNRPAKDRVKSFIEFYGSIPEYDDINHLSNKDFYRRIEKLKETQRTYCDYLQNEPKSDWIEVAYKPPVSICDVKMEKKRPKPTIKPFCTTPILNNKNSSKCLKQDEEWQEKEMTTKPPSRRSVRIETPSPELFMRPKSRFTLSGSPKSATGWDDMIVGESKLDAEISTKCGSAPNSPAKSVGWKDNGITIPKPFEMTVRDEENQIIDEIINKTNKPMKENKSELFKAHPIPIESQIPLFDKIMADQERKNHIVRERSKALLQSQMRPFSFTKRDEDIQSLTRQLSKSSPNLLSNEAPSKVRRFKAKPIPKNLFSNYIYKKMHEDEFYRALQKRIRAEEMLKAASLPPSMAQRERNKPKFNVCPRSFRQLDIPNKCEQSQKYRKSNYGRFERELEELTNEFLLTSPRSHTRSRMNKQRKVKRNCRNSSASSSDYSRTQSSFELHSVNRSNLAALLRIESARKRLETEMAQKLEASKVKEEARWREKIMRKRPIWESLAYSHEDDLAMRLQLRRDEEKLRSEEHRLRMQIMLGRVNQQPTLFERQSQVKYPKTKKEFIQKLYLENRINQKRSISDLSDMVEMKDEAIQAFLDEEMKAISDSGNSKESLDDEEEEEEEKDEDGEEENEKGNYESSIEEN